VVAFLIVYWLSGGFATPSTPNWALAILVGLVVALIWPWVMDLILVRRARQRRQDEIDQEVSEAARAAAEEPTTLLIVGVRLTATA
jgi:uncharacterized membrane protein (DUF485 family)